MQNNKNSDSAFILPSSNIGSSKSNFLSSGKGRSSNNRRPQNVPIDMAFRRGNTLASFLSDYTSNLPPINLNVKLGGSRGSDDNIPPSSRTKVGDSSNRRRGATALSASGNHYDQYKERRSENFTWSADIKCGTNYDKRLRGDELFSPLYIMNGEFLPKRVNSQPTYLETLFDNELYFEYLRLVESKVNRTVSKQFRKPDLYNYLHSMSEALQLYYCLDSILTYYENSSNSNYGLFCLRERMDATVLSAFQNLQKTLEKLPCPKKLVLFIRYHYQNFSFDEISDTTIYRLGFRNLFYDKDISNPVPAIDVDVIRGCSAVLNDFNFQDLISLYLRAIPDDKINQLPASTDAVLRCNHFRTFWHNSCVSYKEQHNSSDVSYTKVCKSYYENFRYYSFVPEDLDGSTYSMGSHHIGGIPCPGFYSPNTNFLGSDIEHCTSITRLYQGRIVGAFSPEMGSQAGVCALPVLTEAGSANSFSVHDYLIPGSRLLCAVDLESQKCSAQVFAAFLFNPNYPGNGSSVQRKRTNS